MKSFRMTMPACPECGSENTRIDVRDYSNLVRIPAAVSSAGMVGIPIAAISFVCKECAVRFKDNGWDGDPPASQDSPGPTSKMP